MSRSICITQVREYTLEFLLHKYAYVEILTRDVILCVCGCSNTEGHIFGPSSYNMYTEDEVGFKLLSFLPYALYLISAFSPFHIFPYVSIFSNNFSTH